MTITEFLLARVAEDEAVARAACDDLDPHWWAKPEHARVYAGHWVQVVEAGEMESGVPGDGLRYDGLDHIARHDPARVLAECASKRAIIHEYESETERGPAGPHDVFVARHEGILDAYRAACCLLALSYADHPDFDEAWRL